MFPFRFKQNIGIVNALIRITVGLTMISFSSAKLVRKPWCVMSKVSVILGAMKVAEGIVRFCPVTEALKFGKYMNLPLMGSTKKGQSNHQEAQKSNSKPDESSHQGGKDYDASDAKLEADLAKVLGTNL
ncbi:YgaP family membrane protein [Ectobacillus ponti]|nr:DUF2892 domain-containing protein [Ectobacillus ponti]